MLARTEIWLIEKQWIDLVSDTFLGQTNMPDSLSLSFS
jgi:hypothetical protein